MSDPADDRVISRVYHEDKLLLDRIDSYLAANAFLVVAFATIFLVPSAFLWAADIVQISIVLLGLFLAFIYIAIGSRNCIAIEFWRECEQSVIQSAKDSDLFAFFKENKVEVDGGAIINSNTRDFPGNKGSLRASVPWKWEWVGSPNHVIGVWVPRGIATFWVVLSATISFGATVDVVGHAIPNTPLFFAPIFVLAFVLFVRWAPPRLHPKWHPKEVSTDDG